MIRLPGNRIHNPVCVWHFWSKRANEIAFRSVGIQNSLVYLLGTRREPLGYISFLETASSIRAWHYANVWGKKHVFIASSCCDTILKHCLAWLFWSFSLKYCWYKWPAKGLLLKLMFQNTSSTNKWIRDFYAKNHL